MSDEVWQRDEIASPCIKICVIHPDAKICVGCYRSGAEIAQWSAMTPEARATLMDDLPNRASQVTQRRGGRAARRG